MPEDEERTGEEGQAAVEEEPKLKLFTRKGLVLMIVLLIVEAVAIIGINMVLKGKDTVPEIPDNIIRLSDPMVAIGEQTIISNARDGELVTIKFILHLAGYEKYRAEVFERTKEESDLTWINSKLAEELQSLVQESTKQEITMAAIKLRLNQGLVEELNEMLKEKGDDAGIKFFKGVLITELIIQ